MFVLFYFLLIRPQQKKQKAVQKMQNELKKGDKVVTIGGLHGIVDSVDEGKLLLNVEMEVVLHMTEMRFVMLLNLFN